MPADYVRNTVAALKEFDADCLVPMHCAGSMFYEIARAQMPDRVILSSTGSRFTFSA
jgi:7,8-dihydropterin-6-yl-methyl-4-(beta-D-ribofuranosyl)aminobenzene 5'-phosphate synthase